VPRRLAVDHSSFVLAAMKFLLLASLLMTSGLAEAQDTAAIVVGGHFELTPDDTIGENVRQVELFGCEVEGVRMLPVQLEDLPLAGIWLPAGVVTPEGDKLMLCGGFACRDIDNPTVCQAPPAPEVSWTWAPIMSF